MVFMTVMTANSVVFRCNDDTKASTKLYPQQPILYHDVFAQITTLTILKGIFSVKCFIWFLVQYHHLKDRVVLFLTSNGETLNMKSFSVNYQALIRKLEDGLPFAILSQQTSPLGEMLHERCRSCFRSGMTEDRP